MSNFDFENFKPVGYVDIKPNGNAYIEVVGYVNFRNKFHYLTIKQRKEMFPPRGNVFAHNFVQWHKALHKHLVCLAVMPNRKTADNLDAYIWDKSSGAYEFGNRLRLIKATISEDGENNFTVFRDNDLIDTEEDRYVLSNDRVFFIKANSKERLIPFWDMSHIDIIETFSGIKYLIASQLPEKDGVVDITSDDQLANWFITKILKTHWVEIVVADTYETSEQYLSTAFNDIKHLTPNVYKSRLERLKRLNTNFKITLEALSDLSKIPWVKNVIEKTVDVYKQTLISDVSAEYKHQLDKMKEEHDMMIEMEKDRYEGVVRQQKEQYEHSLQSITDAEAKISETLDEKMLEIELLDETIALKNEEIAKIDELVNKANKRKDTLKSDFAIIKDVLGLGAISESKPVLKSTSEVKNNLNFQFINMVDSECMMFEAFGKSLEEMLKTNKLPHQNASTIAETLAVYKILIVPDVAYAMSIIHATQKCYYAVEYVNVGWKSFRDLWKEGLCDMVEHCKQESGIMHYLVLHNINLTYLPNFIQPLLDIQMGTTDCLPSGEEYPMNLRILCTITNEEVIPLSEQCIRYIGCIEKPSKDFFVGRFKAQYDARFGYLSPSKLSEKALASPANFYKMYING